MSDVDDEGVNMSHHLPTRPHLTTLRLTKAFRRYDDRPDFERNVSPSELAMRETNSIPTMRR
jgi:hypothetical protein